MIDYDDEATRYDETRGGPERARAAAHAVAELVGPPAGLAVDVAGGTGSVSLELARLGWDVVVLDRSVGMLRLAGERLPGRALRADATRLPLADSSFDLVTTVWLLHLVPDLADVVVAEAARVCRPGGHWVTSVDKHLAHGRPPSSDADSAARLTRLAGGLGMTPAGSSTFTGNTVWTGTVGATQTFTLAAFRRLG